MQILTIPNKSLITKCAPAKDLRGAKIASEQMINLAHEFNLVGLAANQVGILEQMFLVNLHADKPKESALWEIVINPVLKIDRASGESWGWEGCGSIPKLACLVKRWNHVDLSYTSLEGENKSIRLFGYLAIIAQHENDHLNGILMTSKARQRKFV